MTDCMVQCDCGQYALLSMLDWSGPRLERRIYAVSALPDEPAAVFLRNMRSDYCDLTRKAHEVAALYASADAVSAVLAAEVPQLTVLATEEATVRRPLWREDLEAPGTTVWAKQLGVA